MPISQSGTAKINEISAINQTQSPNINIKNNNKSNNNNINNNNDP